MAAGEYSLCFAGYVIAFEILRRREGVATRVAGLLPFALPMAAYLAAVLAFHYGAAGTGFYRSPFSDLGAYTLGAPRRMAVLFASGWLGVDDVSWSTASDPALLLLGIGTIALGAVPVGLVLQELQGDRRQCAIWMLAGSVLAMVPVLATEPSVRVLGVAMIGVSAWVGLIVDRVWSNRHVAKLTAPSVTAWIATILLAFVHFVWAPIETTKATDLAMRAEADFSQRLTWLGQHVGRDKSTVIVFRADSPPATYWTPFMLEGAVPARWRVLSFGAGLMSAIRRTPNTLELVAHERPLFPMGPVDFFRNVGELREGSVAEVPGMRVLILQLDEHQLARRLLFEFDKDIDDPSVQCISERQTGFEEVAPPPVGFGVRLVP
jgi:hypothetical protein